jgi:hypothetical protein
MTTEHDQQTALFQWAALNCGRLPELDLLFAIPNERRNKFEAFKMKAEGVKSGVPDVYLPVARGGYHGLWIELKTVYDNGRKGSVRPEQRAWHAALREQGYYVDVSYKWDDAALVLYQYLCGEIVKGREGC